MTLSRLVGAAAAHGNPCGFGTGAEPIFTDCAIRQKLGLLQFSDFPLETGEFLRSSRAKPEVSPGDRRRSSTRVSSSRFFPSDLGCGQALTIAAVMDFGERQEAVPRG